VHSLIYLNNRLANASRARVALDLDAMLYGRGVFTTLAVYNQHPFLWPEHWARLTAHADHIGIKHNDYDETSVGKALAELIEANKVSEGRARLTLFGSAGNGVWQTGADKSKHQARLLLMTGERRATSEDDFAITVSPYRVNTLSPLTGIKSVNYLDHILAWEEARSRNFDEALMLNERGEIVSATLANLFWARDGTLHTPQLSTGALAGTTRVLVLRLAAELSIPMVESVSDLAHLSEADEIFLTSANLGVQLINAYDFHRYTIPIGSITLRLREALRQFARQTN